MCEIGFQNKSSRAIRRHLLTDPGRLRDRRAAFTDAHPTLCGRYHMGDALTDADYSSYPMCGQCESIAARPGSHGARS